MFKTIIQKKTSFLALRSFSAKPKSDFLVDIQKLSNPSPLDVEIKEQINSSLPDESDPKINLKEEIEKQVSDFEKDLGKTGYFHYRINFLIIFSFFCREYT